MSCTYPDHSTTFTAILLNIFSVPFQFIKHFFLFLNCFLIFKNLVPEFEPATRQHSTNYYKLLTDTLDMVEMWISGIDVGLTLNLS